MKKIKKYKNIIERFLSGESGQRFFNFAYSIGAAIVIWGALFKILHLDGGNTLLCIGMGTEVIMFILTAFDRPARDYHWEEVFPVLSSHNAEDRPQLGSDAGSGSGSGPVVIAQGAVVPPLTASADDNANVSVAGVPANVTAGYQAEASALTGNMSADVAAVTGTYVDRMAAISEQLQQLHETTRSLNEATSTLLAGYRAMSGAADEAVAGSPENYVEQMQALSRNVSGLNTIYEIQLKSVSSQLDAIDRVNRGIKDIRDMFERSAAQSARYSEETEKMARYMQQLNRVYEKMIHAMTIQMYRPVGVDPLADMPQGDAAGKSEAPASQVSEPAV